MTDDIEARLVRSAQNSTFAGLSGCLKLCGMAVAGVVLAALFIPAIFRPGVRDVARRTQCKNNLKQIGLALHRYHERYETLPPAYTSDGYGTPLHSWRTLILPYLGEEALYRLVDLSKPWDHPANAKARATMVETYQCRSATLSEPNHTTYLGIVGDNACFHPKEPRPLTAITDGAAQTLMVIEAPLDRSVPWMSPRDADEALVLGITEKSKLAHVGGFQAALCDGSPRFISATTSMATRRALLTISAGDEVGDF